MVVRISNPEVKIGKYRTMMAMVAARTRMMTVAAAPTSTASGVARAEGESRLEGLQTSGGFGQGTQPPPGRTGSSLTIEAVELPAPGTGKKVLLPVPEEGM